MPQFSDDSRYSFKYYYFGAIARRFKDYGTVGMGILYLRFGLSVLGDEREKSNWEYSENLAVNFAYGTSITENLNAGFAIKYIYFNLYDWSWNISAYTFGFDVGFTYRTKFIIPLTIGINLANMGSGMTLPGVNMPDPLPQYIRTGPACKILSINKNRLLWTDDLTKLLVAWHNNDDYTYGVWYKAIFNAWTSKASGTAKRIRIGTGLEYSYNEKIFYPDRLYE